MYTGNLAAASNRADWEVECELVDPETNAPVDLADAAITVMVTRPDDTQTAIVEVSTATGDVVVTAPGTFRWKALASQMAALCPGEHAVFVRFGFPNGDRAQLIAGELPVIDGGPR